MIQFEFETNWQPPRQLLANSRVHWRATIEPRQLARRVGADIGEAVVTQAHEVLNEHCFPLKGSITAEFRFGMGRRKDFDNEVRNWKSVLDGMQHGFVEMDSATKRRNYGLYRDDKQIDYVTSQRQVGGCEGHHDNCEDVGRERRV